MLLQAPGLLALASLVHILARRQGGFVSIQGQTNVWFVAQQSLRGALREYPKVRPPLYPVLLWLAARVGLRPAAVNELLLDVALVLLIVWAFRSLRDIPALLPAALFATLEFNYASLYQGTAEILFVPLLLALLLLLARNRREPRPAALWQSGALAGALGATRYFGLFFAAPVVALDALLFSSGTARSRLARAAGPVALAIAPAFLWMAVARAETGYWTGADRTAPRHLPHQVAHWDQLRGFGSTVGLMAKTLWIDFFSPDAHASLAVVTSDYVPRPVEYATAAFALLAAALAALALRRRPPPASSEGILVAEALVVYLTLTVALWTLSNNDPLYTRFLYPSYPLVVLLGFHGYVLVTRTWRSIAARLPFWALAGLLAAVHLRRAWVATPVPFR